VDVFGGAHVHQDFRPDGHGDLAKVRFAQQQHERAGLADAAADGQRHVTAQDALVVGELEEVQLAADSELLLERFRVDPDTHGRQFALPVRPGR
jgi:hypothetical protein